MTVNVLTEVVIDRPLEQVSAYAADLEKAPEWYVNIKSVEWKTPPPLAVGSRLAFVAHFLGRRLAYERLQRPTSLERRSLHLPHRRSGIHECAPDRLPQRHPYFDALSPCSGVACAFSSSREPTACVAGLGRHAWRAAAVSRRSLTPRPFPRREQR